MSDYFFYDINKKMADLAKKQQLTEDAQVTPAKPATSPLKTQLNERDLGKHNNATTGFAALAKKTGGGKKGAKIAGAQLAKMRAKGQIEEGRNEVAKGTPDAIKLQIKKLGLGPYRRESTGSGGEAIFVFKNPHYYIYQGQDGDWVLVRTNKGVDESALSTPISKAMKSGGTRSLPGLPMQPKSTDEGNAFSGAVVNAKRDGIQPGEKINVGGKEYPVKEAAKWRDPKHKDKLYTQNPPEDDADTSLDTYYDRVKPAGYQGAKRLKGGDEYSRTDPLTRGFGRSGTGSPLEKGPRKGLPARDQIRSLKGSIKAAHGTHAQPNLPEGGGIPTTPKQKSFAKLAPPVDKITFADRIVGAKKEVDEMLGDVAADAMRKAIGSNQSRDNDHIDWTDLGSKNRKSSTGGRIDNTEPGVTRHHAGKSYSGAGHDVGADDEPRSGQAGRRRVGAGQGTKIGAKINRGTSKLMTRENDMDPADQGEYDREGEMAKDDIKTVVRHAQALEKILGDNDNLPEWVQAKLAKIEGMMTAVDDYMQNQKNGQMGSSEMDEESTNKRDSRAERAGKKVAKDIEYDEKEKDGIHGQKRDSEDDTAEKAGKKVTKDIEYDEKKNKKKDHNHDKDDDKDNDKEEVDETTSSGSVSTGGAATGKGHNYGKGIYDSMNRDVEKMISESMSINMSMNNDSHGGPSNTLTVTATDEDAKMLAGLLKMAGLGHGDDHIHAMTGDDSDMHSIHDMDQEEPCPACGSTSCGCESMDEAYGDTNATDNKPDWPTDEEGTDNAMMYSGGMNGPKSTGQTTIPVINGQNDRMGHAGDDALRRMMEMAGLREAAATPQAVDEPTNTKAKPEAPGSRIKVDPNYKPNAKAAEPASKAPPKIATPQAVDDPSTKIKEGLLMQLRNFKY